MELRLEKCKMFKYLTFFFRKRVNNKDKIAGREEIQYEHKGRNN